MNMLRKMLIPKIRKILRKRSMMKFIFVKLLAYIEHAANLLKIDLPAESGCLKNGILRRKVFVWYTSFAQFAI